MDALQRENNLEWQAERAIHEGTALARNNLAARIALASRKASSPINAYHAHADIDIQIARGMSFADLPAFYAAYYNVSL